MIPQPVGTADRFFCALMTDIESIMSDILDIVMRRCYIVLTRR